MEIKRTELPGRAAIPKNKRPEERLIPGEPGVVRVKGSGQNSTELCRRMFGEFDIPLESYPKDMDKGEYDRTVYDYLKSKKMPGYQAQHIIPVSMADHPVIRKIGMDMNHPQNGIPLPEPDDMPHALSTHFGNHDVYNIAVREKLNEIWDRHGESASVSELEREVYDVQCRLRSALEDGLPLYKKKKGADGYKDPSKKKEIWDRGGGATVDFWRRVLNS